jgi:hypothetical protein
VTLFKTTAGVYSAEGRDFADKTKVFYGEKASAVTNNCTSQGADNKLGFINAPNDFCGFTSVTSTALSSPNIYTFLAADGKTNTKITTTDNGTVLSASVENDKYSFACGLGGEIPSCSNTVSTAVSATQISFTFTKTTLSTLSGANGIVIGSGSLIHQINTNGGSSSLTFNSAKCTQVFTQTAFGITATAYNLCASDAVADFTLTAQDTNTFNPKHDGVPCTITKVGSVVTLTKGAKSLTVQFNGDTTDVITLRTGAVTDTQVENDITARTSVGDTAGQTVRIEMRKNGVVSLAQAQSISTNEEFSCLAL